MKNNKLTKEQSDFAAKYHNLISKFLRMKGYPADEFYDIVVFGYIRAVRAYSERDDLREKYQFQTIAYQHMRSVISAHFHSQNCAKNKANTRPYIEDLDVPFFADTVWERFISCNDGAEAARRLAEILTPEQRRVAYMKGEGYPCREIAEICNVKASDINRMITAARKAIRSNAPDLLEILAA